MPPFPPASASDASPLAGFPDALARIEEPLLLVERAMREQLGSDSELVVALGEHVLGSGGKRMRPALLLLASELCGYTGPRRIHVAAAVELLHTATLLHDDVVDASQLRRGRPAANALWGNRRAVLAGDFLYARASSMIVEDGDLDILWIFANTIRRMAEGELLQLERSFDPSVTEAHYFKVIERKSAVLLAAATEAGSILGGVTRAERRKLAEFGHELGLAFQLRDDALDYEDRQADLGKNPYDDLREGKVTLPLLLALKRCTPAERDAISSVLKAAARAELFPAPDAERTPTAERLAPNAERLAPIAERLAPIGLDLTPALEAVERYHCVADTIRRAEEHAARAAEAIAPFPQGRAKRDLLAAAAFSVARDR